MISSVLEGLIVQEGGKQHTQSQMHGGKRRRTRRAKGGKKRRTRRTRRN